MKNINVERVKTRLHPLEVKKRAIDINLSGRLPKEYVRPFLERFEKYKAMPFEKFQNHMINVLNGRVAIQDLVEEIELWISEMYTEG